MNKHIVKSMNTYKNKINKYLVKMNKTISRYMSDHMYS